MPTLIQDDINLDLQGVKINGARNQGESRAIGLPNIWIA
jgi:hypothetical protein